MRRRLAILATHPIQYYAPVFRELAVCNELDVKVFYGWRGLSETAFDPGFGQQFAWDVPLLDGYSHEFLRNVSRLPGSDRFMGIELPDACSRISQWKPDVLAVFGWRYHAHWQALKFFRGKIPIIFRGDSHLLDERWGVKCFLRRGWLRWVYKHITLALAVGTENRRYFEKHGVGQIAFAPHAVENARFGTPAACSEGEELRTQLRLGGDDVLVGFVGKLEPKKAPDLLLRAMGLVPDAKLNLAFIGTGPMENALRESGVKGVHFLGFKNQTEMPKYYRMLDVLALPSRGPNETWGLVVNEAMASGRPAIVSSVVGCGVDLISEKTGWQFKTDNLNSLVSVLRAIPKRPELLQMGRNARALIGNWTIDEQVNGWMDAVKKLCH